MPVPARLLRPLMVVVNTALLGCAAALAFWPTQTPARVQPPALRSSDAWIAPGWHPATAEQLQVLRQLDGEARHQGRKGGPRVNAPSVILADLDSGEVLYARDADTPRTIASVTKVFSALTLAATAPTSALDRTVCIGREQWPSRPGARSKFETGDCHTGWEYLGGALVASDNRGAMALPAVAGAPYREFVADMTTVALELGATAASFHDPAGIEDENVASARDVLKAIVALSLHPDLAAVASAPQWQIDTEQGPRTLGSTNRLVSRYETLAAKTGYTDTAHYCFATVVRTASGRRLAVAVLGAPSSNARFADTEALLRWAEGGAEPAAAAAPRPKPSRAKKAARRRR